MTPEQVSALSDNELNRAMIWIYPPKCGIFEDTGCEIYCIGVKGGHGYLNDYNLTMPLALDAELDIELARITRVIGYSNESFVDNENPLRAICECLVLIELEKKKV